MTRHLAKNAKRSNRPNPRADRNLAGNSSSIRGGRDNIIEFEEAITRAPRRKRVELIPRNLAQEIYVDALYDQSKCIVFAMGPAGTGKTLLATQYAIKCLQEGLVEKIIITRPVVSVDEQLGHLPGDLLAKLLPWSIPIIDVFKEHYSVAQVKKLLDDEVVEIAPLGLMRGRTLKRSICIFDESQNATPNQMKMMLTRLGEDSRMVVTGDLKQHDRGYDCNGLKDFTDRLEARGSRNLAIVRFDAKDVERHPVIEEILGLYGDE